MNAYLLIGIDAAQADQLSAGIWGEPNVAGIQELPADGAPVFAVDAAFRLPEPGTPSAAAFLEYLAEERFRGRDRVLLRVWIKVAGRAGLDDWLAAFRRRHPQVTVVDHGLVGDEDYTTSYRRSVRGQDVGRGLWVGPPWETPPADRLAIVINPGMAFGTGEHATTRLCLEQLETLGETEPLPARVFDVGTGSGILAIAAAKIWPATELWLSDYDPLCAGNAVENFKLNGFAGLPEHVAWGEEAELERVVPPAGRFGLLLSNLYLNALVEMAPRLAGITCPGGHWIASGLWGDEQWETFRTTVTANGWKIQEMQSTTDDDSTWYAARCRLT